MMGGDGFSFRKRARSFLFAGRGMGVLFTQHNAWIHSAFTVGVVVAGFVLKLERWEWTAVIVAIMAVLSAEATNTAIELLCDVASPEIHPTIGKCKDAAAAGVLICAIASAAIGLVVFGPHLLALIK